MDLKRADSKIAKLLEQEKKRQVDTLMMIPSENYISGNVMEVLGSVLANKYSEGYPGKRYYQGNFNYDDIELLAQERAQSLFDVAHVNVQPYSGTPANAAIMMSVLDPGDTILGMNLSAGGHLSHGHPKITFGGKFFHTELYDVDENGLIDYDAVEAMAKQVKPKLIICGYSAYPRLINFSRFARIADEVDAYLLADISHISGLVVGKMHPSPSRHAHLIMTTTHKTLRGPRGAMIMVTRKGIRKDPELPKKIDKNVFPGIQGGPHNNQIGALAVALQEASKAGFKSYARKVVQNANVLASALLEREWTLSSGGTDNHLILADMRQFNVSGKVAAVAMEVAGLVMNANAIPHDPNPPYRPSGLRFGTPGITSRGIGVAEMKQIAEWMQEVVGIIQGQENDVDGLYQNRKLRAIGKQVAKFARDFPVPGIEEVTN